MINIINIIKQDIVTQDIRQEVILYKGETYTYFDSGLTRHVFVNPDKTRVIKFVIDDYIEFNEKEYKIYQNSNNKSELAETFLEEQGMIIEQEFCNPIKFDDRPLTIKQILFARSCRDEVGWDKDGNLKCFDLSEYKQW